ncbi:MAG: hypothetical protein WBY94_12935 [Polyangiaceae bacterium]
MKRIVLLSIGAFCIPSLVLLGCNDRSATKSYDGGVASTANGMDGGLASQPKTYDGGLASAATGMDAGFANEEKTYDGGLASTDMDSGSKAPANELHASAAAPWEGGLSSRR